MDEERISDMTVRKAVPANLERIERIYDRARELMKASGNPNQWGSTHPPVAMVEEDVDLGRCMLLVDHQGDDGGERILAQFALCTGEDPTYAHIEGKWLDDSPYVTVHRLAASGLRPHSARACLQWAVKHYGNVRGDTHPDNKAMRHVFETAGFGLCGTIEVDQMVGGDSIRVAYQRHDR